MMLLEARKNYNTSMSVRYGTYSLWARLYHFETLKRKTSGTVPTFYSFISLCLKGVGKRLPVPVPVVR